MAADNEWYLPGTQSTMSRAYTLLSKDPMKIVAPSGLMAGEERT
jgi:hypothetical protein